MFSISHQMYLLKNSIQQLQKEVMHIYQHIEDSFIEYAALHFWLRNPLLQLHKTLRALLSNGRELFQLNIWCKGVIP